MKEIHHNDWFDVTAFMEILSRMYRSSLDQAEGNIVQIS